MIPPTICANRKNSDSNAHVCDGRVVSNASQEKEVTN